MFLRECTRLAARGNHYVENGTTTAGIHHGGDITHLAASASRHWGTRLTNTSGHLPHDHEMTRVARPFIPVTR